MSSKGQKKNIVISDKSLYGTDSDDEIAPRKGNKSSSKKTTAEIAKAVKDFMSTFLQEQRSGKIKVEDILASWQSEETQSKLSDTVKLCMPFPKSVKAKDPNAPKRPRSAYILFCNDKRPEVRAQNPEMKMPKVVQELGKLWKDLKDKKKQHYLSEAAKDKERYNTEMSEYGPKNKPKGPKRALSAYFFFCADKRSEVKEANPKLKVPDIAKELGRMWKEDFADEDSRKEWMKKAAEDKKRYEKEKDTWIATHPEEAKDVPKKKAKSNVKIDSETDNKPTNKSRRRKQQTTEPIQVSGMILFMQQTRSKIEAENPNWDIKQVIAEMKKRWSALSSQEREEYDV